MKFKHTLRGLGFVALALTSCLAAAQNKINSKGEMIGERWVGAMGVTETVDQIMARAAWEVPNIRKDKDEKEYDLPKRPGRSLGDGPTWPPRTAGTHGRGGAPLLPQTIGLEFNGPSASPFSVEPPDSMGGVSPTQVLVATNGNIAVYSRTGTLGGLNVSLDSFFNSVRNGSLTSDPQVRWDPTSNRWFILCINVNFADNRILLAVSNGATITNSSSFTFFFMQQENVAPAGNANQLADYPSLGVDRHAVYTGANCFINNTTYGGASAWVIQKSSVLGAGPIVASAFRGIGTGSSGLWAPRGCDNWSTTSTEGYFIGVDTGVFSQLDMRRVLNPGSGTPSMSAQINLSVPTTNFPSTVPQLGGSNLDGLDDRLFAAKVCFDQISNRTTLWTAHNIRVNASGTTTSPNRNACRWYEIQNLTTTPALRQSGTLFDSSGSVINYWMPSVVMTGQGHMVLGANQSSTAQRAAIATAGRLRTDALGTIQAPLQVELSNQAYPGGRWGDYSETCIDPTDNMTTWTFQEYCLSGNWVVRATKLLAPPPATPASLAPNTIQQGQTTNLVLTGTSTAGSEFYDPGAAFPNRLAAAFSGTGLTVNSITFNSPTQVTLNVTAAGGATTGARNLTITNPDGQQATGNSLLTVQSANNPVPTITSIVPNTRQAGLGAFSLTVNGTNFVNGVSTVRVNGSDRTTTFVNATQLTANITAPDTAVSGSFNVTVFNAGPGGGTSGTLPFTVTPGAPQNVNPGSIITLEGEEFGGGLAEVLSSNNAYYESFNDATSLACRIQVQSNSAPTVGTNPTVAFTFEAKVARPGLQQQVDFWRFDNNTWENVDGRVATTADQSFTVSRTSGARFVDNVNHIVRARASWSPINDEDPAQDGWLHSIDRATWQVSP